ncbi:RDD family protein [Neolewinella agarilytica]|uniref:Uncharacterized membrane protein YckC, RDD family n=1 Tax=Neolewinella agarilytica TaxID=478744 RepID=A0A1H8Z3I2_9BACT|nr:RDD family protein [Neolewinella agarilytica]SEP58913.1 Uncharacterized membrane protein YckC, RDD family [Neolewinella agarilytica]
MYTDTLDGGSGLLDQAPRFAGFGPRLGAAIIDGLITSPLVFGAMYFQMMSPSLTNYMAIMVLASLYKPVLEGLYGATPGKMILKLKVVNKDYAPITLSQAFIRYTPWILGLLVTLYFAQMMFQIPGIEEAEGFMEYSMMLAEWQAENMSMPMRILQNLAGWLPLVSALFLFANKRKQAAHDQLAETFVVHKEPKTQSL